MGVQGQDGSRGSRDQIQGEAGGKGVLADQGRRLRRDVQPGGEGRIPKSSPGYGYTGRAEMYLHQMDVQTAFLNGVL